MNSRKTREEVLDLLLAGLAAGDSLGSTSEFIPQADIPQVYAEYRDQGWPFRQAGGGGFSWGPGQPTDDTEMAVCLVRSYRQLGRFDGKDVGKRFVQWMQGNPIDIGGTTMRTLMAIGSGTPWHEGALKEYLDNPGNAANGSLMRNGVVPGIAANRDDAYRITISHGVMTHYAPLPQICCAAQTYLIGELLDSHGVFPSDWCAGFRESFDVWLERTDDEVSLTWYKNVAGDLPHAWETFQRADWNADTFDPFAIGYRGQQGYCLLTLQIAVWAVQRSLRNDPPAIPKNFPARVFERSGPWALAWVAMIGYDSDTYGATTGPLIAAAQGQLPDDLTAGLWVLRE